MLTPFSVDEVNLKIQRTRYKVSTKCGEDKTFYRFGFNGQEKDEEIKGRGNINTAEFWQYDTRTGRRWNLDPKPNISISSYATFSNNPIWFSDVKGDTIRVLPENQELYMQDNKKVLGMDADILFTFDNCNNFTLTKAGQIKAFREQTLKSNKGELFKGVIDLISSKDITNIVYTDKAIINPETGKLYENDRGDKLDEVIQDYGGEATVTISDAKKLKLIDVTQNTVTILKDKVHSPGKWDDPRENNTFHGEGHVLYQKNSEQEKVIEFDNMSRKETGAPKREIDDKHKNSSD